MVDNMIFAHSEAAELTKRLFSLGAVPPEGYNEFQQILQYRRMAQECARDCAPYVHAKLASVDSQTGETAKQTVQFIVERGGGDTGRPVSRELVFDSEAREEE